MGDREIWRIVRTSEKHSGDASGYLYCLRKFFNLFVVVVVSSCCCKLLANLFVKSHGIEKSTNFLLLFNR